MVSNTSADVSQKRRIRSSEKERRRNLDLNEAFYRLQCQIPRLEKTQRLPRIKTLRMAILYINHLMDYLAGKETEDFAQQAMQEMQVKNSYTSRIFEEERQPLQPVPVEYYEVSPPHVYGGIVYQPAATHYWNPSLPSGSDHSSP